MKIRLTEIFWGIDRMTGDKTEDVTGKTEIDAVVGAVPDFGNKGKGFTIDEVTQGGVTVTAPIADAFNRRSFTVKPGVLYRHTPRSFDAGYKYTAEVLQ